MKIMEKVMKIIENVMKIIENVMFCTRFAPIGGAVLHQWSVPHGTIGVCHMAPSECLKIIENCRNYMKHYENL